MGLVIDSSVVIASERRGENVAQLLRRIAESFSDQRSVLSAIGLTELVHGIYRAQTPAVRSRREAFIKELISQVEIYPYSSTTAHLAGKIDGEQQNRGIVIPFVDLMIGATALEIGYSLVTTNVRHFRLIPNLIVSEL
jgi:predicted nucleic acid-binding protein